MNFFNFFRRANYSESARKLYVSLVEQARQPAFYTDCAVSDTKEGRYDLIMLHAFLVMQRLKQDFGVTAKLSQALYDIMFADMDTNLRESGVGDLAVGRRVKQMAKAFYGRIAAYEAGLAAKDDDSVLVAALERNLYRSCGAAKQDVMKVVQYMQREASSLEKQDINRFMAGEVSFGSAPSA